MVLDLDRLNSEVLSTSEVIEKASLESLELQALLKQSDKRIYNYNVSVHHANEEIRKFQELVDCLQQMLGQYNRIQDENVQLKGTVKELNVKGDYLSQKLHEKEDAFDMQITSMREEHERKLEMVRRDVEETAHNEVSIFKERLSTSKEHVERLESELTERDKQRQMDMAKLKLEYDMKLSKLQQRHIAQANNVSMATQNQIYRKKMQHLQSESSREANELRVRCTHLEQEIVEQQHKMKLQNKYFHEQSRQQQEQVRQQDNLLQQYQSEIRRFQKQLHCGREKCFEEAVQLEEAPAKRKKSMFNPKNNKLL